LPCGLPGRTLRFAQEAHATLTSRSPVADLIGASQLAVDATTGLSQVVEGMHAAIARPVLRRAPPGRTGGITGFVYGSIRGVTRGVGLGVSVLLPAVGRGLPLRASSPRRDATLAALNGVVGDHLESSGNPLAIRMRVSHRGHPLLLERRALWADIPRPTGRLLVLVHGLCVGSRQWRRLGHDHGEALSRDLGYTAIYVDYNSGLHVSANGRALSERIEALVKQWPVPVQQLAILGHSMGGLVARSACVHAASAGHRWPRRLRSLVFLGTPHHGAPLERAGNWVDAILGVNRYTAPLGRLGRIRSAGITDLRHGNLLEADWQGRDRFELGRDRRTPVPLPAGVRCHAIAATTASAVGRRPPGDGLVPLDSALGRHRDARRALSFPESRLWVAPGLKHLDLLSHPQVYDRILRWLRATPETSGRLARRRDDPAYPGARRRRR